jgi:transposase
MRFNMANFRRFAMGLAVRLREDYSALVLRQLAKGCSCPGQTRRLLALAVIYDGGTRSEAARVGAVGLQTVRDWVLAFNAAGPDGLVTGKAPGASSLLNDEQRRALAAVVDRGPYPASEGVVRWRLVDLAQWVFDTYGVSISVQTMSRELRGLSYRKLSARPRHHAQDPQALEDFKKVSRDAGSDRRRGDGGHADRAVVAG